MTKKIKIAVYTIAKNEEAFVSRWLDSCVDADYILIADTGSTDNTKVEFDKYKDNRIVNDLNKFNFTTITISPWRFDDARNASLALLPADIDACVCLDMDEVLHKGWREEVEKAFADPECDRLRYNYIWSHREDGSPGISYHGDKIHKRTGFRWKNPVHEVAVKSGGPEKQIFTDKTLIEHFADNTKSRGSYLPLMALAVQENPADDRMAHYYARELMYYGRYHESFDEFMRHLAIPTATWKAERAASMRYAADCMWAIGDTNRAMHWFHLAAEECPDTREPWLSLAQAYRAMQDYEKVLEYTEKLLAIKERPKTYINSDVAWSDWPEQMYAEALEKVNKVSNG